MDRNIISLGKRGNLCLVESKSWSLDPDGPVFGEGGVNIPKAFFGLYVFEVVEVFGLFGDDGLKLFLLLAHLLDGGELELRSDVDVGLPETVNAGVPIDYEGVIDALVVVV